MMLSLISLRPSIQVKKAVRCFLASSNNLTQRQLSSTASDPSIQLYQYQICPFCNKVKALLSYAGIDYESVEVNPLTKAAIRWSKDYRKVPILKVDDKTICGSDEIMSDLLKEPAIVSRLEQRWGNKKMTMADFTNESSQKWVQFANDEFAPLLYPNICRTLGDSYAAFGYVQQVDSFSRLQRVAIRGVGSLAMYFAASKVKKKRNITDERQALDDALSTLEKDGLGSKDFVSGAEEPHMGDIAIFGTLRAIEGLPAHREVVEERAGTFPAWYERMTEKIKHA